MIAADTPAPLHPCCLLHPHMTSHTTPPITGPASPTATATGSVRVFAGKVNITQDTSYGEVQAALEDEPAWQVGFQD